MTSPLSPSPTSDTFKRPPLQLSTGPRALHLVDGNVSRQNHSSSPLPSPLHTPPSATSQLSTPPKTTNGIHPIRRQSSISYKFNDDKCDATLRSPPLTSNLTRSLSLGPRSPRSPRLTPDRRSTGSTTNEPITERPPLTLAEKYVAVDQIGCKLFTVFYESDTQTFYNSLPRRNLDAWNCVPNLLRTRRNFFSVNCYFFIQIQQYVCANSNTVKRKWERIVHRKFDKEINDTALTSPATGQGGAMLEGIKEGVQGVGRFIAAGLVDFSASTEQSQTFLQQRHSMQSNSSASTSTTKSTRWSRSSASSLWDDLTTSQEEGHVLMVHDTGATPTVSPNPVFMQQQQQGKNREDWGFQSADTFIAKELGVHRKKSSEMSSPSPLCSPAEPSGSSVRSSSPDVKPPSGSLSRLSLPPPSSIPGLGSLALVGANAPPVSSWMGSMGKKWEELQRGSTCTFIFSSVACEPD